MDHSPDCSTNPRIVPLSIGVSFISAGVIAQEIALTRIFSFMMWYHFAFLAVGLALLGFAASGSLLFAARSAKPDEPGVVRRSVAGLRRLAEIACPLSTVLSWLLRGLAGLGALLESLFGGAARFLRQQSGLLLERAAVGYAFSVPISFALSCIVGVNPPEAYPLGVKTLRLLIFLAALALPFFFGGLAVTVCLTDFRARCARIYAYDLLGAAAGCAAALAVLHAAGAPACLSASGVLGLAAAIAFDVSFSRRPWWAALAVCAIVAIVVPSVVHVPILPGKSRFRFPRSGHIVRDYRILQTRWTPVGRVDIISTLAADPLAVEELWVVIDADAYTGIIRFDGDLSSMSRLNRFAQSAAYQLAQPSKVLIIGAGGGQDVLTALYNGAQSVVAVEINSAIVNAVRTSFAEYAGRLYERDDVEVHIAEGRHFVEAASDSYDVIQLSLVDTWAATAAGAYSLSENYLYTLEAFSAYIEHLTPDGILTITRPLMSPHQALRVVTTAHDAARRLGIADPERCVAVISSGGQATFIFKRRGLDESDIRRLEGICASNGFDLGMAGGRFNQQRFTSRSDADKVRPIMDFFQASDKLMFYEQYPTDVRPTTDDRPFFFQDLKLRDWLQKPTGGSSGNASLAVLLFGVACLGVLLVLAPLATVRLEGVGNGTKLLVALYFSCLGIGFMFVEIPMMQMFSLPLGHPTYSMSVVLVSLLGFAGLGSALSGRFRSERQAVLALLAVLLTGLAIAQTIRVVWLRSVLQMSLPVRGLVAVGLLAPIGVALGGFLPTGVRLLSAEGGEPRLIPWAWGVNGVFSVAGSALAVGVAIAAGFRFVAGAAAVTYIAAAIAFLALDRTVRHRKCRDCEQSEMQAPSVDT